MKLPSAWRVQAAPSLQKVSGSGADFNGTFKTDGGLDIQARLDLKKRIYQPEDWESVRHGVLEFRKIMETTLILSRGGKK